MAAFNPQTQDVGVLDMTRNSQGTGPNRTFETLFKGLANTASDYVKTEDQKTQMDIEDQASAAFDGLNQEFGLDAPSGVTDGVDRIKALQNAVSQGKISEVNYYGRLATISKQLRAKYPNYEHIVDQTIQSVTGTRPANAFRDAIFNEITKAQNSASDKEKFRRQYEKENAGILDAVFGSDYFVNPGSYDFQKVQQKVAEWKGEATTIEAEKQRLSLNTAQSDYNDKAVKKVIDRDFSFVTQSTLNKAIDANGPTFADKINQFVASGGGSPEELNKFIGTISQVESDLRTTLYQRGQADYVSKGLMTNDELNKHINDALYPVTKAKEAVLGGDFKLASKYATINNAIKDEQLTGMLADPEFRAGAGLDYINKSLGDKYFVTDPAREERMTNLALEVAGRTAAGQPGVIKEVLDHGNGKLSKATVDTAFKMLTDPNLPQDGVSNIVKEFFGPQAKDFMSPKTVAAEDLETLYTKFLDPRVTDSIFSKGTQADKEMYTQWAFTKALAIPSLRAAAGDVNSLLSAAGRANPKVIFDDKNLQIHVEADNFFKDARVNWGTKGRAVNAVNKVLSVLGPIAKANGMDPAEATLDLLKNLSISIDGVNPEALNPEQSSNKSGATDTKPKSQMFFEWLYNGIKDFRGGQSKEAIDKAVSDSERSMQRLPEPSEDSGEIDYFSQKDTSENSFANEDVKPTGGKWLLYANQGAVRSQPLSRKLVNTLGSFIPEMGITMKVFSGGQPSSGPNRTGSHRHDNGNAADVFFYKDGKRLDWASEKDRPIFEEIVRRAREAGITGIGAGHGYMQPGSMHIGFGTPAAWGAGGHSKNAPQWLVSAFNQ